MKNVMYIISEECKDRNFKYDLCNKINCLTFLTYSVINSIAMSTQYEEITEMYESGVMKKTITLEKPTEVMGGVDPKYSKAANVLGFLLDKSPKDVDKETCELVYSNAIFHPAPDNEDIMACNGAEISEEAYKTIRQSLGFYKQSEVDELQQKDNK